MRIQASTTVNAPVERVWPLLADLDGEPRFWKGTVAVRTLARTGDVVDREVTLAFRNARQREKVYLHPPLRVVHEILEGPMRGTKVVAIQAHDEDPAVRLQATWDITLRGFLKLGARMVSKHIEEGTRNALERIKEAAESGNPRSGSPSV
jgi:uncharacterized membrane protein